MEALALPEAGQLPAAGPQHPPPHLPALAAAGPAEATQAHQPPAEEERRGVHQSIERR